jgi:hypothetical protein
MQRESANDAKATATAPAVAWLAQLGEWRPSRSTTAPIGMTSAARHPRCRLLPELQELLDGPGAGLRSLRAAIRMRRDDRAMAGSGLGTDGRALDALIGAYLAMCDPWTDPLFTVSRLMPGR